jgi:hypothetical protein
MLMLCINFKLWKARTLLMLKNLAFRFWCWIYSLTLIVRAHRVGLVYVTSAVQHSPHRLL